MNQRPGIAQGIVVIPQLVDEARLLRLHACKHPAVGQGADLLAVHMALLGHDGDKLLVHIVDHILGQPPFLFGHRAEGRENIFMGPRFDFFFSYAQLFAQALHIIIRHIHANASRNRRRIGVYFISIGRQPVRPRRSRIAHGYDDGLARILQLLQLCRRFLRRRRAAAGAVDAQQHSLYAIVLPGLAELAHQRA